MTCGSLYGDKKPFKLISYPPIIWIFSSLGSTAQLARFGEAWVGGWNPYCSSARNTYLLRDKSLFKIIRLTRIRLMEAKREGVCQL